MKHGKTEMERQTDRKTWLDRHGESDKVTQTLQDTVRQTLRQQDRNGKTNSKTWLDRHGETLTREDMVRQWDRHSETL